MQKKMKAVCDQLAKKKQKTTSTQKAERQLANSLQAKIKFSEGLTITSIVGRGGRTLRTACLRTLKYFTNAIIRTFSVRQLLSNIILSV